MSVQHFLRVDRPTLGAFLFSNRNAPALARAAGARRHALADAQSDHGGGGASLLGGEIAEEDGEEHTARCAFHDRLVDTFRGYLEGVGADPTDTDLRTFALLVAEDPELQQRFNREPGTTPSFKRNHQSQEISRFGAAL